MNVGQLEKGGFKNSHTHTQIPLTKQISEKYICESLKYYIEMFPVDMSCLYLKQC